MNAFASACALCVGILLGAAISEWLGFTNMGMPRSIADGAHVCAGVMIAVFVWRKKLGAK